MKGNETLILIWSVSVTCDDVSLFLLDFVSLAQVRFPLYLPQDLVWKLSLYHLMMLPLVQMVPSLLERVQVLEFLPPFSQKLEKGLDF